MKRAEKAREKWLKEVEKSAEERKNTEGEKSTNTEDQINLVEQNNETEKSNQAERTNQTELTDEKASKGKVVKPNQKIWKDLKDDFLEEGYASKCAYCEGDYDAGNYSEGEHYRPKAEITVNRKKIDHPGYYWLVYEWYNLLLSCKKCNAAKGKMTEFPLVNPEYRVSCPNSDPTKYQDDLSKEEPLLLHPYFDQPEEHFSIEQGGFLVGKTERGKRTIEICNLNRPKLREKRRKAEELIQTRLNGLISLICSQSMKQQESSVSTSTSTEIAPANNLCFGRDEEYSLYLNKRAEQYVEDLLRKLRSD